MQNLGFKGALSATLAFVAFSASAALSQKSELILVPLTNPLLQASAEEHREVQYQVINHGKKAHTFSMKPMMGITQNVNQNTFCKNETTLQPGKSCVLSLEVAIDKAIGKEQKGPLLCDVSTGSNNKQSCFQPIKEELIGVQTIPAGQASLSIRLKRPVSKLVSKTEAAALRHCFATSACTLALFTDSDLTGNLEITNTSPTYTVYDIAASNVPAGVHPTLSNCTIVPPGGVCDITFEADAGVNYPSPGQEITIQGRHTIAYPVNIEVLDIGDDYDGAPLYVLPTFLTNYDFFTADTADIGPAADYATIESDCDDVDGQLPDFSYLTELFEASDCDGGPISGFQCLAGSWYWSDAHSVPPFAGAIDMSDGTIDNIRNDGLNSFGRCTYPYEID
jgi:hypothetical protein